MKLIDDATQWPLGHVSVDPIKHSLSFKVNGRWFAYLDVRRRHFLVGMTDDDEIFKSVPIKSDEEFEIIVQKMKAAAQRVLG